MRPSEVFEQNRALIRDAAPRYRTSNPRVFGSVLHGTDIEGSDIDILIDTLPGTTLFDLIGLEQELEKSSACRFKWSSPMRFTGSSRIEFLPKQSQYERRTNHRPSPKHAKCCGKGQFDCRRHFVRTVSQRSERTSGHCDVSDCHR